MVYKKGEIWLISCKYMWLLYGYFVRMGVIGMIHLWPTDPFVISEWLYLDILIWCQLLHCVLTLLFDLTDAWTCKFKLSRYVLECHITAWSSCSCNCCFLSVGCNTMLPEFGHQWVLGVCATARVGQTFSKWFCNEIGFLCLKLSILLTSDLLLFKERVICI